MSVTFGPSQFSSLEMNTLTLPADDNFALFKKGWSENRFTKIYFHHSETDWGR